MSRTIPKDFSIHTMTCSFLAFTDTSQPVYYRVQRTSDRRSYIAREVKAEQNGRVVFISTCNFCLTGSSNTSGILHQPKLSPTATERLATLSVPPASEKALTEKIVVIPMSQSTSHSTNYSKVLSDFLTAFGPNITQADVDPFVSYDLPPKLTSETTPSVSTLPSWTQCRGVMSDSPSSNLAVLACLSDAWFLNSVPAMAPATFGEQGEQVAFMTTLNHTIWFHDPQVKVDDWLLSEKGITWAAANRCLIDRRLWSKDGKLVATCVQEGALRLKENTSRKGRGEQGLIDGSKL